MVGKGRFFFALRDAMMALTYQRKILFDTQLLVKAALHFRRLLQVLEQLLKIQ